MSSPVADQQEQTAVAAPRSTAVAKAVGGVIPWDPFALMDRLDADTFIKEMQGIASDVLVYTIKDGAKETVGLSKGGVDECCTMLVSQGQVIREENLKFEFFGDGEDREAIFTVTAARFAVHPDGREVRCDQVLGVKREALYEERAPLSLESRVAGKKWRHMTYRQALEDQKARDYLGWIVEGSTFDDATKEFVRMILDGEDVAEFAMGKRFNPFWFEHGAMKAARNARFRLIPAGIKAQVMAMAKQSARVKNVDRAETAADPQQPVDPSNQSIDARAPLDEPDAKCPKCGGRMWDNRTSKTNPKSPDFKCRDKSCEGVFWPGQWPPAALATQEQQATITQLIAAADLADAEKEKYRKRAASTTKPLTVERADEMIGYLRGLVPPTGLFDETSETTTAAGSDEPIDTRLAPGKVEDALDRPEGEQRATSPTSESGATSSAAVSPTHSPTASGPAPAQAPPTTTDNGAPADEGVASVSARIANLLSHEKLHENDRKVLRAKLDKAQTLEQLRELAKEVEMRIELPF